MNQIHEEINLTSPIDARIVKIEFSTKPKSSYNKEDKSSQYSCDGGSIQITLDNGIVLNFWNSEWGGMGIYKKENITPNNIYKEYTMEDLEDTL